MKIVAGVDEVGRGPLAGPVVAACVAFPEEYKSHEIRDSKQLSAKMREYLAQVIKQDAIAWCVIAVGHRRIGQLNIREASRLAMSLAVKRVATRTALERVLVDGNVPIDTHLPQQTVIGGDAAVVSISAASIVAKVYRDSLMRVLDQWYPGYDFSKHAGYPTVFHRKKIAEMGPSPVHRVSFRGVKEYLPARPDDRDYHSAGHPG